LKRKFRKMLSRPGPERLALLGSINAHQADVMLVALPIQQCQRIPVRDADDLAVNDVRYGNETPKGQRSDKRSAQLPPTA
jgi:hypothetical protein